MCAREESPCLKQSGLAFSLLAVGQVASYWLGAWRSLDDGQPSWSGGGFGGSCPNVACKPTRIFRFEEIRETIA